MKMEILVPPERPTDPNDQYAFEEWKKARKAFVEKKTRREKVAGQVFTAVMG
jgi:hypothetical protein